HASAVPEFAGLLHPAGTPPLGRRPRVHAFHARSISSRSGELEWYAAEITVSGSPSSSPSVRSSVAPAALRSNVMRTTSAWTRQFAAIMERCSAASPRNHAHVRWNPAVRLNGTSSGTAYSHSTSWRPHAFAQPSEDVLFRPTIATVAGREPDRVSEIGAATQTMPHLQRVEVFALRRPRKQPIRLRLPESRLALQRLGPRHHQELQALAQDRTHPSSGRRRARQRRGAARMK